MRSLKIAGIERWQDLERDTLQIEQVLTYAIDTCSFHVSGVQPVEGEEVIIEDDDIGRLFAGIIVKVELIDKDLKIWAVECDDYTALLDRRLVVETYENMSASDIFLDIVAKYCPGFTTTGVRTGAPVVEATGAEFEYKRPSECFKWLCDYVGWHWYVDYNKNLHFFSAEELASPAPLVLKPGGPFRFGKHSIDTQGLRNRVFVRGGTMLSDPQVVRWKADGVARIWALPWPPHEVSLTVGEVPMTVGVENLHDEADFDYMMSFSEKYIRCSSQTSTPAEGTTMSLTARQDIPVITMVEDYASQAAIAKVQGGDGIYEHVISDDSLISIAAAEAAGMADLREHSNPRVKGSFETEYAVPLVAVEKTALEHTETTFADGILSNVEMTENGLKLKKTGNDVTRTEDSQADFEQGTLVDVVVGDDGLELEYKENAALSFDGVDDYVEVADNSVLSFNGDFTIEATINIAHLNQAASAVLTKRGTSAEAVYAFWVINTGQISYQVSDNGRVTGGEAVTTKTVTPGQQHHIALRRSGTVVQVLIDGELDNSSIACSGIISPPENLFFAKHSLDTTQFFPGIINNVRIWNVARTQQQIQDNMNKELVGNESGLVGYWKLNEGSGTTAYDSTANGNHGTIYGGATWVDGQSGYTSPGSRISPPLDLSAIDNAASSQISWSATTPTGTSITIECAINDDPNTPPTTWQQATNGGSIPGITAGADLTGKYLWVRQTLSTTDTSITPQLHSLTVRVSGEQYVASGYYLSPPLPLILNRGKITASQLSWNSEGEGITVEVDISLDGGKTWEGWQECEAFGVIPVLPVGMMLSGSPAVRYRVTLSTEDPSASPVFHQIDLSALAEVLESHNWQPGQIVDIRLPDRGVEGEYLIQRVTITPTWSNPSIWTFRVDYGGRLLGIADFLKALVSAQQKKRVIEPTKNVQKYIYGEETLTVGDELITATRGLPFVCGDADAVCGLVVVSNG